MTRNQWLLTIGAVVIVSLLAVACIAFLAVGMLANQRSASQETGPAAQPPAQVTQAPEQPEQPATSGQESAPAEQPGAG
ncbi:MAG: hypothetical protein D6791_17390, partial [Chloroflexi bacterium]